MKYIMILLTILLGISSCMEEEELVTGNVSIKKIIDTLWTVPFIKGNDNAGTIIYPWIAYENDIIYVASKETDISKDSASHILVKIDTKNREVIAKESTKPGLYALNSKIYDDLIFIKYRGRCGTFNKADLSLNEYVTIQGSNPRAYFTDDYIYYSNKYNRDLVSKLFRITPNNIDEPEFIYELSDSIYPGAFKSIESMNAYIHPENGHEMVLLQHRMAGSLDRVDLVFYDISARQIVKIYRDLEPNGNSSVGQILIVEDKAFFQGVNTIYGLDLRGDSILWKQQYLSEENFSSFLIGRLTYASEENLIIIKADGDRMFAFHPETGEEAWVNSDTQWNGEKIYYHEGQIFMPTYSLYVVNASTGETTYKKDNPFIGSYLDKLTNDCAIDKERNLLYLLTERNVLCVDIETLHD